MILFVILSLLGCANQQQKRPAVSYKIAENKKVVKSSYEKMTPEQASGLLESFVTDGIELHRQIAISASNNNEIQISLYSSCGKECKYIVSVFAPCSGETEYYFKPSDTESQPMFNFIGSEIVLEECCFGPRKSWFRRMLHI
jgi:uncharacterized lipoprotein NlpE involved in copper resistance